ncbi:MAG: glutamine-hydrolyzing carbamoyl-phosphate synthase small subunit [Planctomycetota bacterium]
MSNTPAPSDADRTSARTPHRPARLVLADGTVFRGRAFGAPGVTAAAEVVFNTALTGYQESLTDPSYRGQILVQTTPLIGNTGTNPEDVESDRVQVAGMVVHELSRRHSNYRADASLDAYLGAAGVPGLCEIDTRALTRLLRVHGTIMGVLSDDATLSDADLLRRATNEAGMSGRDLASGAGVARETRWDEGLGEWAPGGEEPSAVDAPVVLAIDCGAKRNILRHLVDRGCRVRVIPADTSAEWIRAELRAGRAHGLFISNGPGDPAAVDATVEALRGVIAGDEPAPPTFGICLGHQLLSRAIGAETYKLPFGHRGTNQPVVDHRSGVVSITSQNHGFAVDRASLEAAGGVVTHEHLNDGTVAGFELPGGAVFSVQYHPEASPGPHDAGVLFDRFVASVRASALGRC